MVVCSSILAMDNFIINANFLLVFIRVDGFLRQILTFLKLQHFLIWTYGQNSVLPNSVAVQVEAAALPGCITKFIIRFNLLVCDELGHQIGVADELLRRVDEIIAILLPFLCAQVLAGGRLSHTCRIVCALGGGAAPSKAWCSNGELRRGIPTTSTCLVYIKLQP